MRTFDYNGEQWTVESTGVRTGPIERAHVRFKCDATGQNIPGSVNPAIGLDGMSQEQLEAALSHALQRGE